MRQRGVAEAPARAEFAAYSRTASVRTDDSKIIIRWMDGSSEDELVLACALKSNTLCTKVFWLTWFGWACARSAVTDSEEDLPPPQRLPTSS